MEISLPNQEQYVIGSTNKKGKNNNNIICSLQLIYFFLFVKN